MQVVSRPTRSGFRSISVPLAWYARLADATQHQLQNWEEAGARYGIHWPDIDEELSAEGLLLGISAPRLKP
jgi:hypothetical protein